MSVTSPVSASPSMSLLDWDEAAVQSYLAHLGLNQYEDSILGEGITGDVLSQMDHAALQDLGMASVGHRLSVLRSVWELKKEQGIEMSEDDWRPQDAEDGASHPSQVSVDRLWDLILEQHDRLMHLERDYSRMLGALEENGIVLPTPTSAEGDPDVHGIPGVQKSALGRNGSLRWKDFEKGDDLAAGKVARRASTLFPSSLASSINSNAPPPGPLTSDSATFQDSFTPTTASAAYPFDSPLAHMNNDKDRSRLHQQAMPSQQRTQAQAQLVQPPPLTRLVSGSSILGASASPPGTTPSAGSQFSASGSASSAPSSKSTSLAPSSIAASASAPNPSPSPSPAPPSGSASTSTTSNPTDKARSRAKDAAHSAAKSFRVTLEDPCWKVLPAALKKYKINDDWKMYALFICFDNTERCLSYDEKPLMLFQKLKETGHRPVFMLRHIKDIKSPIAVAQQKQATKLGFPANTPVNLLPKIKPTSDTSISPTKASTLQPSATRGEDGQTPNGGTFPELPSPGLRDGDGSGSAGGPRSAAGAGAGHGAAGTGTLVDKEGNVTHVTYAVAIYPYIADREDEFHVAVGSTFVILSKSKGWYIVQKDPDGLGNIVPDPAQSGWVPAGCLLELSQPISVISPTSSGEIAAYPGLSTLPPSAIMSSSYAGHALMDYEAKGDDELTLKEGEKVRVYKKYCHWSYSIKSETGERGWVPAWFVGKTGPGTTNTNATNTSGMSNSSGSNTNETTAPSLSSTSLPAGPNTNANTNTGISSGPNGAGEDSVPSSATTATPTPGTALTGTGTGTGTNGNTSTSTAMNGEDERDGERRERDDGEGYPSANVI